MLSELPEGFGFIPVQSISCGTPVISKKSGSLKKHFPEDHGIVSIIGNGVPSPLEIAQGQEYSRSNYSITRCVDEYLDCFNNASIRSGVFSPINDDELKFSPWCYFINEDVIWHDLLMKRVQLRRDEAITLRNIMNGEGIGFG